MLATYTITLGRYCLKWIVKMVKPYDEPVYRNIGRNGVMNLVGGFLFAYGFIGFFCAIGIFEWWAHTAPHMPDDAKGNVIFAKQDGAIVYLSAYQVTAELLVFATSIPLSILGIILTPKRDFYRSGGKLRWKRDDVHGLYRVGIFSGSMAAPIIIFLLGPALVCALNYAGL